MMAEVPPDHWIAPALSSRRSFLEPLQCGAIKTMGVHKPWSPSRSYGLVVRLEPDCGRCPACTAAPTARGTASAAPSSMTDGWSSPSKGGDCLVAVDLAAAAERH